jgi:hypothetical protein
MPLMNFRRRSAFFFPQAPSRLRGGIARSHARGIPGMAPAHGIGNVAYHASAVLK